ncbi:MAG: TrkA C-terminal domain-containing protein [Halobacteriaceae archaeon]
MSIGIDEVDERILYHLAREGRHTSAPDIAEELDVSPPTKGYHAHIDYEKIEGRLTNLFICTTTSADRERFARRLLGVSGVVHVKEVMTGRGDLHVIAVGTDTDDISRIGRNIKAFGVEIEDEDLIHRQHFTPYHPFGPEEDERSSPVTSVAELSGDADVFELRVSEDAPIVGKTVNEAAEGELIDSDMLVITIEREDRTITPHGDTTIQTGDLITVLSRAGLSNETIQSVNSREEV